GLAGGIGIVGADGGTEAVDPVGDGTTDAAVSHYPDGQFAHLGAVEGLPLTCPDAGVGRREPAKQAYYHALHQIGHCVVVHSRCVDYFDTAARCGTEINVVHTDTVLGDDLEVSCGADRRLVHLVQAEYHCLGRSQFVLNLFRRERALRYRMAHSQARLLQQPVWSRRPSTETGGED